MRTVWKFPFPIDDHLVIAMPSDAELLHVDWQDGQGAQLWALVDDTKPPEPRRFRLAGTGHKLPDFDAAWRFVGTFLLRPQGLVFFHLWETSAAGPAPLLAATAPAAAPSGPASAGPPPAGRPGPAGDRGR